MRFISDDQRKAAFARLGGNRFSFTTPLNAVSEGFKQSPDDEDVHFSLKDDVRKIVALGDFDKPPAAEAYLDALDETEVLYGEPGVRTQALYIATNLNAMNDKQEEYLDQLLSIGYNKPYTSRTTEPNTLSEIAYERLLGAFMEYSEDRQNITGKIGMEVFRSFAEKRGVPLEWALVANDWTDEALTEEAKAAVKDAWTKVKVKGLNA